jgi:hypothetical protein
MSTLCDIQLTLAEALKTTNASKLDTLIRSNGLTSARRLQIYRNNIFHSFTEALRACYPVVERLVGKEFFDHAARRYIEYNPSRSGNLHNYGDRFPDFLMEYEPAQCLAYLPDIARLEWARQKAYHAADKKPLDVSSLQLVPQEKYGELYFQLHPSAQLLRSDYPILRIWEVNQPNYSGSLAVDLTAGKSRLLILRRDFNIEMRQLSSGEFHLLHALAAGHKLTHACEQALEADPGFDVRSSVCHHVAGMTIVGYSL